MKIIEFNTKYSEQVKDLLVELQLYIVGLDEFGLNIITDEFRETYFVNTFNELNSHDGKMFLAVSDDRESVFGLICGYIHKYDESDKIDYVCPKTGIVSELIISEKYRRMGIGQALIDAIEKYFTDCGCEYSKIDVFAYNKGAKKLYEKNNYVDRLIPMSKRLG